MTAGRVMPEQITLEQWADRYAQLKAAGLAEPWYGGSLARHVADGDTRLRRLLIDNSAAALRLWNFLLSEEDRLFEAAAAGMKIVGTMKDLGTAAMLAWCWDDVVAFCPDGAWWIPCLMEMSDGMFAAADELGVGQAFCPVRAMLGAFATGRHFPWPQLLTCSVGATCDDFSAIAQRVEGLGREILWWEALHRRAGEDGEEDVLLPGGFAATAWQVELVAGELGRIATAMAELTGVAADDEMLRAGIARANRLRGKLAELRRLVFSAEPAPLGATEEMIAEMLAIHYCSDPAQSLEVVDELLAEVRARVAAGQGVLKADAVRVYWVNPPADLRAMNLLERAGGRVCGSDYMVRHSLDAIDTDDEPLRGLAKSVLADAMVGPVADRAERVGREAIEGGIEAVVVSAIPGASHCAAEARIISQCVGERTGLPVLCLEIPPLTDSMLPTICTRFEAMVETVRGRRA